MTIQALDVPVETAELARWLERQLMSDRLGALVAELRAAQASQPEPVPPLDELLGSNRNDVLGTGLTALSDTQLRRLFQGPDTLFELQELVLVEGGEYWDSLPRTGSAVEDSQRNWQTLQSRLELKPVPGRSAPGHLVQARPTSTTLTSRRTWMLTAVAGTVTVGIGLGWLLTREDNPFAGGMAWTRPNAFRPAANRQEFLTRLATLSQEWFDERPATTAALANRIQEFRRGCTRLQENADAIPWEDREWLLAACLKWSAKLDQHLIDLKGGRPLGIVKQDVDATIQKLITRLKTEAQGA